MSAKKVQVVHVNSLQWRHNEHNGVSNHQPNDCLHNRLFRHRSKKTSKLCVTGHCEGNSPVTGIFPAQRASNAENVSIRRRHHVMHIFIPYKKVVLLASAHSINSVVEWIEIELAGPRHNE